MKNTLDNKWMQLAIEQAERAQEVGEVPVGAVLVHQEQCIAVGHNQPIGQHDPTAHAEIQVLRQAGQQFENYRLLDTTLYVTLEPCVMCIGAIMHARVARLVFGAYDPKAGAVTSVAAIPQSQLVHHKLNWQGGVCQSECSSLLKQFFQARRAKSVAA